jgi:hypothetical protein
VSRGDAGCGFTGWQGGAGLKWQQALTCPRTFLELPSAAVNQLRP